MGPPVKGHPKKDRLGIEPAARAPLAFPKRKNGTQIPLQGLWDSILILFSLAGGPQSEFASELIQIGELGGRLRAPP